MLVERFLTLSKQPESGAKPRTIPMVAGYSVAVMEVVSIYTNSVYRYFVVSGHIGGVPFPRTPAQAALLAPLAGASRRTPSSISKALPTAPATLSPSSKPPARMTRVSFFPLPADSAEEVPVSDGSSSIGKRPYAHQQNENAKHTNCQ